MRKDKTVFRGIISNVVLNDQQLIKDFDRTRLFLTQVLRKRKEFFFAFLHFFPDFSIFHQKRVFDTENRGGSITNSNKMGQCDAFLKKLKIC